MQLLLVVSGAHTEVRPHVPDAGRVPQEFCKQRGNPHVRILSTTTSNQQLCNYTLLAKIINWGKRIKTLSKHQYFFNHWNLISHKLPDYYLRVQALCLIILWVLSTIKTKQCQQMRIKDIEGKQIALKAEIKFDHIGNAKVHANM